LFIFIIVGAVFFLMITSLLSPHTSFKYVSARLYGQTEHCEND